MVQKKSLHNLFGFFLVLVALLPVISYGQLTPPEQEYVLRFTDRSVAVAPDDPAFDLSNEFTIAGWFYLEEYEENKLIYGRLNADPDNYRDAYVLRFGPEPESLEFIISDGVERFAGVTWENAPFGEWVHIAVTLENDTTRLYGNGVEEGKVDFAEIPTTDATPFTIGLPVDLNREPTRGYGFKGMIRQFSIWETALTPSEIEETAKNHLQGDEQGLLAYWKMEEFPGPEIPDSGPFNLNLEAGVEVIERNKDRRYEPLWYLEEAVANPYFNVHEIDLFELLDTPDQNFGVNPIIIDFNHDGLNDIIVIQTSGNNTPPYEFYPVFFLQNTGNFNFTDVTGQFSAEATGMFEFKVHDFDGDGLDDIVTATIGYDADPFPGAANELFLSSDNYSNSSKERYPSAENGFTHGLATGDVDNDGDIDIFEPNWGQNVNPLLLINNGVGFFENEIETYLPETYVTGDQAAITVHLADFNRDGFDDFIMGVSSSLGDFAYDRDRLLFNTQNNHFEEREFAFPDRNIDGEAALPIQMVSGDFDGDGYLDVFTSHFNGFYESGFMRLYTNNQDSTFSYEPSSVSAQTIDTELSPTVFSVATAGDFNQDGWLDVYIEGGFGGSYLFLNDGAGKLEETNQILSPKIRDGGRATVVGDLNGDGRTDILQFLPFNTERSLLILENARNFDTGATPVPVPQAPQLTGPDDGAETNHKINFTWEEQNPHPFSYFQLATDAEFTSVVDERDHYTGLSIRVDSLDLDQTYYWRVRGENYTGNGEWSETRSFTVGTAVSNEPEPAGNPRKFALDQNYPNPFNPTTTITFALPEASQVRLEVYNMLGQKVATLVDERRASGNHQIKFDASSLSSGLYVYQLQAGSFIQNRKMLLIK